MHVGIYAKYQRCEATHMAIQLAEMLELRGCDVSIFSATPRPPAMSVTWDRRVINQKAVRLHDWAATQSALIWIDLPSRAVLRRCCRNGLRTIVVPPWYRLRDEDFSTLRLATYVVPPCEQCAAIIKPRLNENVYAIPWAAPYIRCHAPPLCAPPRVVLPLMHGATRYVPTAFGYLLASLVDNGLATGVVIYDTISPAWHDARRRLRKTVEFVRVQNAMCRREQLASASLALYAGCHNYCGLTAIESLAMGTPLATCDCLLGRELVRHEKNGIVLPVTLGSKFCDNWRRSESLGDVYTALSRLLRDTGNLKRLASATIGGLLPRQQNYANAWCKILGLS